jgi:methionine salvage enolase-phosphatase E1
MDPHPHPHPHHHHHNHPQKHTDVEKNKDVQYQTVTTEADVSEVHPPVLHVEHGSPKVNVVDIITAAPNDQTSQKTSNQTTITFTDQKKKDEVLVPIPERGIKVQREVKVPKPKILVTRIYGVTSQSAFGDQMYKYFLAKLYPYIYEHFDDPILQEIIGSLREQVNKDGKLPDLPLIAAADEPREQIVSSICEFVKKRAEINRLHPDSKTSRTTIPAYIQLKSLILQTGLHSKEIISHFYEDAASAFKVWSEAGIKLYSLSSGTNEVQADYFSRSNQGNMEEYLSGHISTTNPQVSSGESGRVDFRGMANKILGDETFNIVFLTDKVSEAKSAANTDMTVFLVSREGKLGHQNLEDIKEELEIPVVSSFKSIVFT